MMIGDTLLQDTINDPRLFQLAAVTSSLSSAKTELILLSQLSNLIAIPLDTLVDAMVKFISVGLTASESRLFLGQLDSRITPTVINIVAQMLAKGKICPEDFLQLKSELSETGDIIDTIAYYNSQLLHPN